jgi:sigma-B regulation protein RsbU (phosphoserine phosphatase)
MLALHYKPSGNIEFVNGGHIPPFLALADGTTQPIPDGDVPVGLLPGATFHSISLALPAAARIVLVSDGITETEDSDGVQFGASELAAQLAASDPIHATFTSMNQFSNGAPPHDDCTILVIDRTA